MISEEEVTAQAEVDGIGAERRRKNPPKKPKLKSKANGGNGTTTGLKPVDAPTAGEAAKEVKKSGPDNDAKSADGTVEATKTFVLDYTDGRGYHWSGSFTSHILTIRERATVGLTRSRMAGGVAAAALDETTGMLLEMQAHLAVSLSATPEWAENLDEVRDVGVLAAIYKEVVSHEATFWGTGSETGSEGEMES